MSGMTSKRLAEIREWAKIADTQHGGDPEVSDLLAHVDHLTAENARLRAGIEDARMYCSRSTFCVTIPPTGGEADDRR